MSKETHNCCLQTGRLFLFCFAFKFLVLNLNFKIMLTTNLTPSNARSMTQNTLTKQRGGSVYLGKSVKHAEKVVDNN